MEKLNDINNNISAKDFADIINGLEECDVAEVKTFLMRKLSPSASTRLYKELTEMEKSKDINLYMCKCVLPDMDDYFNNVGV